MSWADRVRSEVPMEDRAKFLTELQAFVAALRTDRGAQPTPLLHTHQQLALDYLDEGPKKNRARALFTPPS